MKPLLMRRSRQRHSVPKTEVNFSKKESTQEQSFFGGSGKQLFFKPTLSTATSIQRKCEKCEEEEKKVNRKEDKKEEENNKVLRAEDKEEEKADRVAEHQEEQKADRAADEKEEEKLQKKESTTGNSKTQHVSGYIRSLPGKGNLLPAPANNYFSSRMGYDFSQVKVHTDNEAAASAKNINAKAYTVGNNVVFNEGQYNISSLKGKKLLAHELVHVMQQQSGATQILQRLTCDGVSAAPPRVAHGTKNAIDSRAQEIIDIAAGTGSIESKAISIGTEIICKYFPADAAMVDSVIHKPALSGVDVKSKGSGAETTGIIGVGDTFIKQTTAMHFARRVLQVGHELEHIKQYRSGMAGDNNKNEREFLAFADNAVADEFEGTGRMTSGTRLNVIDGALGYFYCLSADLQKKYSSKLSDLQTRRKAIIDSGKVDSPGAEPTTCSQ